MSPEELKVRALAYHKEGKPGKIAIVPTKPFRGAEDLSLAYTPGVAQPCLAIKEKPETVWDYTARGNMVAVVSDGTAVLGLGNIGAEAGLPVMEGKAVLFKQFADIDAVALCLNHVHDANGRTDAQKLIAATACLEPSFGGINLEDIAAPACFTVETELKKEMKIPVFHDDQHGTAIISLAGILNALLLVGKKIGDCKFVMSGAGAAGLACAEFYVSAGAKRENFILCDINGTIRSDRTDLFPKQLPFARPIKEKTLAEAIRGADVFMGVSAPNVLTQDMIRTMAKDPIVFAMANPNPEIAPGLAWEAGAAVVGTGRSDFPNQVNNVLGFPGIFRGALDVRARNINEEMKMAASLALAEIAREAIPADVREKLAKAYPGEAAAGLFDTPAGVRRKMVIPKPFDPRVVPHVARRVAEAAIQSGVARVEIKDFDAYEAAVAKRIAR